ncbi:MAG TPA: VTT domain-containing protein [Thermodesulfobacteriota bacterium]|nr:VTT domain-containing protein [Thermodesulfobacteriota bacterium]
MDELGRFLDAYGPLVLFAAIYADQLGLPLPGLPVLLAAGALTGGDPAALAAAVALAVAAAVLADLLWYALGRRRGRGVLKGLCRLALEPDSCIRRTQNVFLRHGVRALLVAKFLPGVGALAPPLAGALGVRIGRFLAYDGAGAVLWAGSYTGLGYLFRNRLDAIAATVAATGHTLAAALAGGLGAYVLSKVAQRWWLRRRLRQARIEPEELRRRLDAGEPIVVLDVRHLFDVEAAPYAIPGALRVPLERLAERHREIPRDRDVVVYCT